MTATTAPTFTLADFDDDAFALLDALAAIEEAVEIRARALYMNTDLDGRPLFYARSVPVAMAAAREVMALGYDVEMSLDSDSPVIEGRVSVRKAA